MEFVTIIAEDVLGRLASFASQEVCLAWGARLELTKLNKTLSTINLVLADAEKKQVRNPLLTHWLRNLKDVCHDVDDVLDELEFQKLQLKVEANNCGKIKGKALPLWLEDSAKALQSIYLDDCDNLTELPELQKFTFLEQLQIKDCSNFLALPQGMHCLTELRELKIDGCPKLSKSCKRQFKGEDWSKFVREAKIKLDSDVDTDEEEDEDEGTPMINQADGDAEGAFHDHNAISSDN